MSYVRAFKKTLADGSVQAYYARVESYREDGKVRQRVLEYLGSNPQRRQFPLDPPLARKVAAVVAEPLSPTDAMGKLKDLGFDVPFRPRQLMLLNNPPLRRLALRVE
ncbi:MAG: hypothetical protein KGI98_16675 [Euryarchaeota archaeon]|nr:hypothetical protein [Euryarchaeota archaeon]MDE1882111.1 hypothetical protein [Euryarchaeota archaeon]